VAPIGTTVAVFTARGTSFETIAAGITVAVDVVTIYRPIAVVIHSIGAEASFASRRCAAVVRTTALVFIRVAHTIAAERG